MKLAYTIIYVPEVEAVIAFYEKAFGLYAALLHLVENMASWKPERLH